MIRAIVAAFAVFFRSRLDLSLELLALRQQLVVLKRKRRRPVLSRLDRLFWIILRGVWPRWSDALAIVKPATVIAWHRKGFRLYWRWRSRRRSGRPRITEKVRSLIRQMWLENADWGAPKIHGELVKLGLWSRNARSTGICEACGRGLPDPNSAGRHFSPIIARRSSRLTSSLCPA